MQHFKSVDEIWHAGDFGSIEVIDHLKSNNNLKGVYGNIDGPEIRTIFPKQLVFMCEEVKVMIRHIGGSPPRYNPATRKELQLHKPLLFISGHSHILKIMYDEGSGCLHINPGAAGKQGWHKVRTLVRLTIDGKNMKDAEVIELGNR